MIHYVVTFDNVMRRQSHCRGHYKSYGYCYCLLSTKIYVDSRPYPAHGFIASSTASGTLAVTTLIWQRTETTTVTLWTARQLRH